MEALKEYLQSKDGVLLLDKDTLKVFKVKCCKITINLDTTKPNKYKLKVNKNNYGSCCGKGKSVYTSSAWHTYEEAKIFIDKHICK